eukprot:CAMPEP_0168463978 /NCGR_PEP_ID=MMETSP0228-20121227/55338_1 /TAXON_ID=133427 /ORGANISM="Protoceratium reticulatum, Strain CCCM 535 (=CCMP 1889)" /LENGTH=83 /DNA_ID=CAMNT_0008479459 /DNA_START=12 /DNA_END=260 /DNA_ORIENTATION=+
MTGNPEVHRTCPPPWPNASPECPSSGPGGQASRRRVGAACLATPPCCGTRDPHRGSCQTGASELALARSKSVSSPQTVGAPEA